MHTQWKKHKTEIEQKDGTVKMDFTILQAAKIAWSTDEVRSVATVLAGTKAAAAGSSAIAIAMRRR